MHCQLGSSSKAKSGPTVTNPSAHSRCDGFDFDSYCAHGCSRSARSKALKRHGIPVS